jgi:tetratricopeptide (TPR) repeat protein
VPPGMGKLGCRIHLKTRETPISEGHNTRRTLRGDQREVSNNLAILLMSQGRVSDALEHFRIGLGLRPRYGIMRANFANALVRHGNLPEAIVQYELATRELHDNPDLYRNYAIALVSAGRIDLAIPVLGRALELAPADPVCMQLLKQARSNFPTS